MSKRILVVDDEADIRAFLTAVLHKNGYETLTAGDGLAALELVKKEPVDLITLDLQMPNKTGTDFYRKLVQDKRLSGIPVIVISGLPGRHLAVREPAAVFDKPIDPDAFIAAVEQALV